MPLRDRLLLTTLLTEVWALEDRYLDKLTLVITRHAMGEQVTAEEVQAIVASRDRKPTDEVKRPYHVRGSVAVIPIGGVLAQYSSQVNGLSQPKGTSYEGIREAIRLAQADAQIGSIALLIDSPGGMLSGLSAAADTVYSHRTRPGAKPIVAHVDGMMASAALWLGSQAARVTAESSGDDIGSLGVRTQRVDVSQLYEREGIKVHSLKTAAAKDDGFPYKPMSEEEKTRIEASLQEGLRLFKSAVARGRNADAATVDGWADARMHHSDVALGMRMLDGIKPFEQVVAELNAQYPAPSARTGASGITHHAGPGGAANLQGSTDMKINGISGGPLLSPDGDGGGAGGTSTATAPSPAPGPDATKIAADAVAAERQRIASINTRAAAYLSKPGVAAAVNEAIKSGMTAEAFSDQLVTKILPDAQPPIGGGQVAVTVGAEERTKKKGAHSLSILDRFVPTLDTDLRGDRSHEVAKAMGYSEPAAALRALSDVRSSGFRRTRLLSLAAQCATAAGASISPDDSPNDILAAAAHSRSDLPFIFADTMNRTLAVRRAITAPVWNQVCRKEDVSDFRDVRVLSLGGTGDLEELPEGKSPRETSITDREETGSAKTYARSITISYQMVVNDDLNAIKAILSGVDERTRAKPDRLLAAALALNSGGGPTMSDNVAMFHSSHRNLAASGGAIAEATLDTAVIAMRNQRGFGEGADEVIPREPAILLVPTALGPTAEAYFINERNPDAVEATAHRMNRYRGRHKPVVLPYLASATRWYLFADPNVSAALAMYFLNGQETAIFNPISNGSILEQRFEWIFNCGIGPVEFESAYSNPGP